MNSQETALSVAQQCFAVRLRKLNRIVSRFYDDSFRPFGITISQFNLLVAITAKKVATPAELSLTLSLEKSTVSRNINKMLTKGWIEIQVGEDRRTQKLTTTQLGKNLLETTKPAWEQAQQKAEKAIGNISQLIADIPIR